MGCCAVRTNDIMDEAFSSKVIKTIKDNLEANLVNQSMLNMDLDNKRKKFENKNDKITTDDIIRSYLELILNLTNIKNDQDKADIKDLLFSAMNMSSNNFFSLMTSASFVAASTMALYFPLITFRNTTYPHPTPTKSVETAIKIT
jgi:hypothetical protein